MHRHGIQSVLLATCLGWFPGLLSAAGAPTAWIRPQGDGAPLTWGRRDGIVFGLPSPGGLPGPRGLVRVGIAPEGKPGPDLINFIAFEPVVGGRKGFSELERSRLDGVPGKRLTVTGPREGILRKRKAGADSESIEELLVTVECERFLNGAHVRAELRVRADQPEELQITLFTTGKSAPVDENTLTATMGNYGRLRRVALRKRWLDSREVFKGYRGPGFVEKQTWPLAELPRLPGGDVFVAAVTDEKDPASVKVNAPVWWRYRSIPLTQYWRVPAADVRPDLRLRLNGRRVYWRSRREIPGGVSFENFELRQKYVKGQTFIFGLSRKSPGDLGVDPGQEAALDANDVERFARLALDCVHREYPNKISHVLAGDGDVKPPRELTPVFCGCYDWHSAVHAHWLLVRLARRYPSAGFAGEVRAVLARSFTPAKVADEVAYLLGKGRRPFERPYGLAWLLQLAAELHEWDDPDAVKWASILDPLVEIAVDRLQAWFPKLTYPIRTGEHSQTAFAMGLILDFARQRRDGKLAALIERRARDYYLADRGWNLDFEPGGQDFLSPGLAEADLMRRVLSRAEFGAWLAEFLPGIGRSGRGDWLRPAVVSDRSDGKLAHLDGLNLSRAWMLEGIVSGLPVGDPRAGALRAAARQHRRAGLAAVTGAHYEGGHWLGSFAVYLVTRRGVGNLSVNRQ